MAVCSCTLLQSQIFKILCLTYLPSAFKILRKISRLKNFCLLHGFALHYESVELAQNLRILCIISMQKVDLPILKVETDFVKCKFCQKLNQFSQVIQELIKTALFLLHWESYIYDVHKKWLILWPHSSAKINNRSIV